MAKRNRWARADETLAMLVERFPRAFKPKGVPKTPLKQSIYWDLRAALPGMPGRLLMDATITYTGSRPYLRALVEGVTRIDLDGWPAGEVTLSEALTARKELRIAEARAAQKGEQHAAGSL